jgi:hypothetical protein
MDIYLHLIKEYVSSEQGDICHGFLVFFIFVI